MLKCAKVIMLAGGYLAVGVLGLSIGKSLKSEVEFMLANRGDKKQETDEQESED